MSEEDNDNIESTNDETEEVLNTEEVEETTPEVETEDESEALKEKNKKLFERAKKAEAEAKEWKSKANTPASAPASEPSEKQDGLSSMDTIALIGAKVTEKEDIDEVMDYAKLKGLSIHEALQSNVVKTILKDKADQRATAEATNTSTARRGTSKPTSEKVLEDASKGKLPENPEDLANAWMESKLNK